MGADRILGAWVPKVGVGFDSARIRRICRYHLRQFRQSFLVQTFCHAFLCTGEIGVPQNWCGRVPVLTTTYTWQSVLKVEEAES